MSVEYVVLQRPGSISQTEAGDMETDGVDSDDDNDALKSDQVSCTMCRLHTSPAAAALVLFAPMVPNCQSVP